MNQYETLLLLDARRTDAEIEDTLKAFAALVTERNGDVASWERWGRRKLAYEIDDQTEGFYAICNFTLDPNLRTEIETALPFIEGLVRAKTVRRDIRTRSA